MEFGVPKSAIDLWKLRIGLLAIIIDALLSLFAFLSLWWLLPIAVLSVLEAVFIFVYIPALLKSYKITLTCGGLSVSYGVIIRTTRIMPYVRLVYISSFSTPLSKRKNLSMLCLKAARGILILPEITKNDAKAVISKAAEVKKS